jgi:MFS family permease
MKSWYVVAVLMLANVSSFVDRQILSLLVGPIRRDLEISDTGMSLLMGLSFSVLYTVAGLPIGRLADARSRRGIIGVGVAVWSVMTMLCGVSRTFGQLFLARVGVGVGEATLAPPAYSLISDYFPRERVATALSVYSAGIYIGSGLALMIGGLVLKLLSATELTVLPIVGPVHAWQTAFFVIGLPGLLIALLFLTVREPPRREATPERLPLAATLAYVRDNARTFLGHQAGIALIALASYAAAAWLPTMFVRRYGWALPTVGLAYGACIAVFGTLGIVLGGRYADRALRRGHVDAKMRACLLGAAGMLTCGALLPLARTGTLAVILLVPLNICAAFPMGAAAAVVQELTPNRMRAQVSSLYLLGVNLIGLGFGPTAVALLTDRVFHADAAVGASLAIVMVASLTLACGALAYGRGTYARTIAYRDTWVRARA